MTRSKSAASQLGRQSVYTMACVMALLFAVVLACDLGEIEEPTKLPQEYVGNWKGDDGSSFSIRGNSTADYKLDDTDLKDATVEYFENERSLELVSGIFGDKSFSIDEPPREGKMKLSGVYYRQVESLQERTSGELPSDEEAIKLAKEAMDEVISAARKDDYKDFYNYISELWRSQTTPDKLKKLFTDAGMKSVNLAVLLSQTPKLTKLPTEEPNEKLKLFYLAGEYDSDPVVEFRLDYILEGKEWKLYGVKIETKN